MKSINKDKQTAVFENLKTGQSETRDYSQLYSIVPTKPHPGLLEAGLVHQGSNGLLDVDHETLRHRKYKNIFGIGDVNNLPTTKTFWGGFHQLHVVRNNVQRSMKGQTLNALYSGYTKGPLFIGQNALTQVGHYYNQRPLFHNFWGKSGGPIANARYYFWAKLQKKRFLGWYLKKSWGPPTFKLKRTFRELPGDKEASQKDQVKGFFQATNKAASEAVENVAQAAKETAESPLQAATAQARGAATVSAATDGHAKVQKEQAGEPAQKETPKEATGNVENTEKATKKATDATQEAKPKADEANKKKGGK